MYRVITSAIAIFLGASCVCAQATTQVCADSALPEGVRATLASGFTDWRIETAGDLNADYQKAWTAKRANECPGIAAGHFDGKGELSYGLLLIPRAKGKSGYRLVVFSKASGKSGYSSSVLDQSETYSINDLAVYRAEPGLQFNEEKFSAFKLKSDGIYFETFEKGGSIYYWKRGRYQHVTESD
jgi:hypothetical protein